MTIFSYKSPLLIRFLETFVLFLLQKTNAQCNITQNLPRNGLEWVYSWYVPSEPPLASCGSQSWDITAYVRCKAGYYAWSSGICNSYRLCIQLGIRYCSCPYDITSIISSSSSCIPCPAGSYLPTPTTSQSLSVCASCLAGSYSLGGASSCTACPAGTFSSEVGSSTSSSCVFCPAYTYSAEGSSLCTSCPDGLVSLPGSSSCSTPQTSCSEGQYLSGLCANCSAGSYQNYSNFTGNTCFFCPQGTYGTGGSKSPLCSGTVTCPVGFYPIEGAVSNSTIDPSMCMSKDNVVLKVSGLQSDGTTQFLKVQSPAGITYSINHLGIAASALTLSSGSYLSTSLSTSSSFLSFPKGNSQMSLSVFLKCPPFSNSNSATVIEWGLPSPSTYFKKFSISVLGSGVSTLPGPVSVCDNKWHHVAQVLGDEGVSTSLKRYVDGALVSSTSFTFAIPDTGNAFRVGWNGRKGNVIIANFSSSTSSSTISTTWTVPNNITQVNVLIVGGGGGGGGTNDRTAGGGGAGGFRCLVNVPVSPGSVIPITVGGGGSGGFQSTMSSNGGNSAFGSYISFGGGGGGGNLAKSGGSGGGVKHGTNLNTGGAGTDGQGFSGGPSGYDSGSFSGVFTASGGGGAGGFGLSGTSNGGGAGGTGAQCPDVLPGVYFAGGGGGSSESNGGQNLNGGPGGIGGGGNGAKSISYPTLVYGESGISGTGGGGGGGYGGGNGGSGIILISFDFPFEIEYVGSLSLSDAMLYSRALTSSEVLKLASPPLPKIVGCVTPTLSASATSYVYPPCNRGYAGSSTLVWTKNTFDNSWSSSGITNCTLCGPGMYSFFSGSSSSCILCPPSTYSYGGSSGCSSCNAFTSSNLLSSSLGCSPSSTLTSGPSDTSFYLSGSINEGVSAYVATNLSSLSYVNDYLGALNGALNLTNGGALSITPAIGSSLTLPIGNDEFSMSVWVKCDPPLVQGVSMTVFSYGQENGNNQFAHSINVKSGVGVSTVDSDVGKVITIAGSGSFGYADGEGTNAQFRYPQGIVSDPDGFIYVSDQSSHRIRKISPFGFVSTLAGSGTGAYAEGFGTNAVFNFPTGLCIDAVGNIYVADNGNNRIRLIKPSGIVSTFAGSGTSGFEDGVGTSVKFNGPVGVVISLSRTLYVTDNNNHRIRMISDSGVVSTFAGKSSSGYSDGIGTNAIFSNPRGLAIDASGTLYVTEDSHRIRMITSSGVVTTLAGSGSPGFSDGFRTSALFNFPVSLAIDPSGNIFVGDRDNHRIRMIKPDGLCGQSFWKRNCGRRFL
jgi:sugar lactone lactonase YvrE